MAQSKNTLELPKPTITGEISLEQLLVQRRSIREYPDAALSLAEVGQLLWAAQGFTHAEGLRTAPSAGALYPLELYVVAGRVEDLVQGVYHYAPGRHQLVKTGDEDVREALARAALSQSCVSEAPAVIVFTADTARTTKKYGDRGRRYVEMEVGYASENVFLQAEALGLATVPVGAFEDEKVAGVLRIPGELQVLLMMPVGRK